MPVNGYRGRPASGRKKPATGSWEDNLIPIGAYTGPAGGDWSKRQNLPYDGSEPQKQLLSGGTILPTAVPPHVQRYRDGQQQEGDFPQQRPSPYQTPYRGPAATKSQPGEVAYDDGPPHSNMVGAGSYGRSGVLVAGPFAQHAMVNGQQWTPEMHAQMGASMSPSYQLGMSNLQQRQAAAAALHGQTMKTYNSMGGPSMTEGQAMANRAQSGMTPDQQRYVAGHQQIMANRAAAEQQAMQMPPPPEIPIGRSSDGRSVRYLPQMGTDGSVAQSRFVEGSRTPYGSRVVSNGSGGLALIGERHVNESSVNPSPSELSALRRQGEINEWQRAAERTAAGGGLSLAGRYAQKQKDIMALRGNRGSVPGGGQMSPALAEALDRQNQQRKGPDAGASPWNAPPAGRGAMAEHAAAKAFKESQLGGDLHDIHAKGGLPALDKALAALNLSPKEKQAAANWFTQMQIADPENWSAGTPSSTAQTANSAMKYSGIVNPLMASSTALAMRNEQLWRERQLAHHKIMERLGLIRQPESTPPAAK